MMTAKEKFAGVYNPRSKIRKKTAREDLAEH
jgi:hypothetical protein